MNAAWLAAFAVATSRSWVFLAALRIKTRLCVALAAASEVVAEVDAEVGADLVLATFTRAVPSLAVPMSIHPADVLLVVLVATCFALAAASGVGAEVDAEVGAEVGADLVLAAFTRAAPLLAVPTSIHPADVLRVVLVASMSPSRNRWAERQAMALMARVVPITHFQRGWAMRAYRLGTST